MRIEQFKVIYHSKPENPLYDSVAILRMPVDECQNIIDEAIYERLPLFPEMFYDTVYGGVNAAEDAARDYNDYKGLYDSWIKRDKVWLRSPLRVRYPLKLRHGVIIRAKLNIPMIEREEGSPQTYWEYDGFLAVKGHNRRLFWTFEQRNQRNNDYMYFITDFGRQIQSANGHHLTMAGVYLTTGQDEHRSIVTSDIVMRRIPGTDVNAMERLMHETAGVVDKAAEIKEVEDLLIACRSQRH
jgi:hypothetical protein